MRVAVPSGALAERNFRFVFTSTTISALGDGISTIALAFASCRSRTHRPRSGS
jgi:hypothetical protein